MPSINMQFFDPWITDWLCFFFTFVFKPSRAYKKNGYFFYYVSIMSQLQFRIGCEYCTVRSYLLDRLRCFILKAIQVNVEVLKLIHCHL